MSSRPVPAFALSLPVRSTPNLTPQVLSLETLRTRTRTRTRRSSRVTPPLQPPQRSTHGRRRMNETRACASPSPATQAAASEPRSPFDNSSAAEKLFASYKHPAPSGTAKLARERNIALTDLSAAYGHILAGNIRADIPITLDRALLCAALESGLNSPSGSMTSVDTARLGSLVTRACDPAANAGVAPSAGAPVVEKLSEDETAELSSLYGAMLAKTLLLSAFELESTPLRDALDAHLADEKVPFPMDKDAYDEAFSALLGCSTEVLGTAAVDAADTFFKEHVVKADGARDVQGDGYIVSFEHTPDAPMPDGARAITLDDSVSTVLRARLLDGRCIVDGTIPENAEDGVLLKIDAIPLALSSTLVHQAPGDNITVFYHPYAAHEVLPLFLTPDQIPPQSGLVLDIHIVSIIATSE